LVDILPRDRKMRDKEQIIQARVRGVACTDSLQAAMEPLAGRHQILDVVEAREIGTQEVKKPDRGSEGGSGK